MPAALRAIADLARAGAFKEEDGWDDLADKRAEAWETLTLDFFTVGLHSPFLSIVTLVWQQLTVDSSKFRGMRHNAGSNSTKRAGRSLVRLERIKSMKIRVYRQSRRIDSQMAGFERYLSGFSNWCIESTRLGDYHPLFLRQDAQRRDWIRVINDQGDGRS